MIVSKPQDLPDLRLWLLDQWRSGPYRMLETTPNADPRFAHVEPRFDIRALTDAELWWITPEMSSLVGHAAGSLPATTLTEELAPDRTVLAWFAKPLAGIDSSIPDHQIPVQMLLWQRTRLTWAPPGAEFVTIALYGPGPVPSPLEPPLWPLGRTDWRFGTDTQEPAFDKGPNDSLLVESMAQDRRWLAALLLLTSQPLAESSQVPIPRPVLKRSSRANLPSDVRLVNLRAPERPAGRGNEQRTVEWSHRWIVGGDAGGFWRQQAYGPNHSLRRPLWIAWFVKGPKDKPLVVKDTVRIVRDQ